MTEATHLCLGLSLASASGLRATMPFFVVSVFMQLYPNQLLFAPDMDFVTQPWFAVSAGVLSAFELFADKVPTIDHWLHLFLMLASPMAGAMAVRTFMVVDASVESWLEPVMVLGALLALNTHLGRGYLRLVSTRRTDGWLNPVLSLLEDLLVLVMVLGTLIFSAASVLIALVALLFLVVSLLAAIITVITVPFTACICAVRGKPTKHMEMPEDDLERYLLPGQALRQENRKS